MGGRGHHTARADGFTLIEMIAVVLILGLAMSLVVPNLSATRSNRLRDQGRKLAHKLEVARQRAIATGVPHRVYLELEEGWFRVEWWVDEATALGTAEEEPAPPPAAGSAALGPGEYDLRAPLPMSPPVGEEPDFHPLQGGFGRIQPLGDDFYFVGVDSEDGWLESGAVEIVFGPDGIAERSEIRIADAWDNVIALDVEPLIELIRVREVDDV